MVLETGFLPGSHGSDLGFRWAGVALLFLMLTAMALFTKMYGYKESEELVRPHRAAGRVHHYEKVQRMTGTAAWLTSIAGSVILCVFWWLNLNIGAVESAWREVLH